MNRNAFWALIDQARSEADSVFDVAPALTGLLLDLEPDETVSFARHIKDLLAESYRWDLWAVAYIVNGGSADDGFEYFRGWLIAQGRERFQAALENPASIGDYAEPRRKRVRRHPLRCPGSLPKQNRRGVSLRICRLVPSVRTRRPTLG